MFLPTLLISFLVSTVYAATGGQFCAQNLCVNAAVNGNSVTYQLVSKFGFNRLGWMAMGFGTKMGNSLMVIVWPNSDGSVTISQRQTTNHAMPTVIQNPTDVATLVPENTILSSNSTSIAFTYPLPSTAQNAVPIIWAYSVTNPSSSAVDATIVQHNKMGSASIDLTQQVNDLAVGTGATTTVIGTATETIFPTANGVSATGASSTGASSSSNSSSTPSEDDEGSLSPDERTIRTHGILMSIGFLVCLPLGIFIARFSRTVSFLKDKWFTAHWIVQFIVSGPFIISGWFIGYNFVGEDHFQDSHTRAGLLLLLLWIVQMILGTIIHFFKPKRPPLPPLGAWYHEPESSTTLRPLPESSQPVSSAASQSYPPTLAAPSTTALVSEERKPAPPNTLSAKDTMLPAIKGRPIQNYAHALLGLFIILLALYNVHEGYGDEWLADFGTQVDQVPFLKHLRAWWIVALIVLPLVYIAGLSLLPRQWRQETNARRTLPAGPGFRSTSA